MANVDTHFQNKKPVRGVTHLVEGPLVKWSSRRSIIVALVCSAALWAVIFYGAKALIS